MRNSSPSRYEERSSISHDCLPIQETDTFPKTQLLYNLFDWPTHRAARLVILGIANTLDLPERLLPKISSRLGNNKVVFKPYTAEQLKKIVHARLEDAEAMMGVSKNGNVNVDAQTALLTNINTNTSTSHPNPVSGGAFDAVAIELASRKVAAVSGDARRVLELCRRAAELAESAANRVFDESNSNEIVNSNSETQNSELKQKRQIYLNTAKVLMKHIKDAMFEMFQSPHMRMLEAASRHDRIFLCALLLELRRSGVTEASTTSVMRTHEQLCRAHGESLPPAGAAASIACRLAASGLLLADPGRRRAAQRVCLNVPTEDVVYALKDERRVQERKVHALTALRQQTSLNSSDPGGLNSKQSLVDSKQSLVSVDSDRGDIPWIRQIDL